MFRARASFRRLNLKSLEDEIAINFYPNFFSVDDETVPDQQNGHVTPPLNEQEIEQVFRKELDERIKNLMNDFEKQLTEVTKEAKNKIDEIAPRSTAKSPKAKK